MTSNTQHLISLGIKFEVSGDKLKYSAPHGVLTPEIKNEIKQYKTEIIAELTKPSATLTPSHLRYWIKRAESSASLNELRHTLREFSSRSWHLESKAILHSAYTPVAQRLIKTEQADKWKALENLDLLCWNSLRD